ncbi:MAG: DEAD/DEAH box helicase [Muribaculaceae bacterium]|nr:DEAD/DEAH box helicase [Muribaculaceae bacterium]
MTKKEILSRVENRLGSSSLTPMQQAVAGLPDPCRAVVLSPTGSGKTVAFAIPLAVSLRKEIDGIQSVVIAPTRELVLQVAGVLKNLLKPDFGVVALYGGHNVATEVNAMSAQPAVIVATPGRLLDHLRRGHFEIKNIAVLVLDEYDKSLDLGFMPDIKAILKRIGKVKTVILTSATVLAELPEFPGKGNFVTLDYTGQSATQKPRINFRKVESAAADKLETLEALLRDFSDKKSIVFVNHRDAAERVYANLRKAGASVGLYHGGMEQDMRERALLMFVNGTTPVLVSTDLASRGLDIDGVDAVIHYHLPVSAEAMTHRNGRTGRMGAEGEAFAIISGNDKIPDFFPELETYWPEGTALLPHSDVATIYINAGKQEKISRGDVAGFLIHKGGLEGAEVGKIDVKDHAAYAAVPADKADAVVRALAPHKIKNTRVRVSKIE